jgi:hypothetical protein
MIVNNPKKTPTRKNSSEGDGIGPLGWMAQLAHSSKLFIRLTVSERFNRLMLNPKGLKRLSAETPVR